MKGHAEIAMFIVMLILLLSIVFLITTIADQAELIDIQQQAIEKYIRR